VRKISEKEEKAVKIVRCPVCGEEVTAPGRRFHFLNKHSDLSYEEFKDKFEVVRVEVAEEKSKPSKEEPPKGEVPWRTPPTATDILRDILEEYGVKDEAKRIILRKSERLGGLDPNALYDLLRDLNTGIPDKAIHHLTDDYYWALRNAERQAREMGARVRYPLPSFELEERRPIYEHEPPRYGGYGGYYGGYGYRPEPGYYGGYGGYAYRGEAPPGPKPITAEELERWWRDREERQRREELERWTFRELPDRLRSEMEQKIGAVKSELSGKLDEVISAIRELREGGKAGGKEEPPLLQYLRTKHEDDKEEMRRMEERHRQEMEKLERDHEKELEKLREEMKTLREELKEERRLHKEEVERIRKEAEQSKTGRTAYDLAHETIQTAKEWLESRPGERMVKIVFGGPSKKLEETEEAKPKVEELLPKELIEEE
jgi:F0F1-type ATP synthase membrane subunit b/b'